MQRRDFIKTSSMFVVAGLMFPSSACSFSKTKYIGLQLYTIRDEVHKNIEAALEKLAEIGYNSVEAAGYNAGKFYGYKPKDFKKLINNYGMILPSTHTNFDLSQADVVIENTCEAGISYLVIPWLHPDKRKSIDSYKQLAEEFNIIGEKCKKSGIQFAYHNHDFEFETIDGQIPYDVLLNNTDDELVKMQLDLYWIKKGGYDPIKYFENYPGRFELWHVKDMDDTAEQNNIETGRGIIDFKRIFEYKKLAGMKYFFIELDNCILPPYECVKVSYDYMKKLET